MKAFDRVTAARAADRLTSSDFISALFGDSFFELHGDRRFADDKAIKAGIGMLGNMPVTVIGLDKGKNTKERVDKNFGSAHPEGYRKALRLMKQAEKFRRPVLCFVDTSGAFCGIGAEERGQGQAIAENLMEMMTLKTPILSIFIGEGGSGGALALAVANEVWMLENAVYSVISPEGCASILWKDPSKTADVAQCLRLTANDLFTMDVIERIIREPRTVDSPLFDSLRNLISNTFSKYILMSDEELLEHRYNRFRKYGQTTDIFTFEDCDDNKGE
ncbi:MAG: acetyl-CoA carboxylase carboxyl transferase subunit alpha [Acutalibacteraceae bacterium]|nr:acetyl-CoA carboxylase carboxyl transferase subunit alpha [Acutalibacteraceae bacterium]